ncbi:MAG TPA: 6-carboxytetrahydropterin synthase QueD [Candidatus Saccharimonadales bacterium]|nr:6-carboxytetrahydropterin synthase QueD [Candidatus Saccharimonadales bacterium]
MIVCKEITFDAAHKLENYPGKCQNLHGHTYKLQICVKGEVQQNGLVIDIKELKECISKNILAELDHAYLNDIIKQPSIENISMWIWDKLKDFLPLYEIKLWETPTNFVIYSGV